MRRTTPVALSRLHSLWRSLLLRIALVVTLGLLTTAALLVVAAFNNELVWLLMLSLVAGIIPVFSAVAERIDAVQRTAGSAQSKSTSNEAGHVRFPGALPAADTDYRARRRPHPDPHAVEQHHGGRHHCG
jgi:hypothetical protein